MVGKLEVIPLFPVSPSFTRWTSQECKTGGCSPAPGDGPFHVRVVGLLGLAPSQIPQSARREHDGDAPKPAERPECPDEEEAAGGLGDLAARPPIPITGTSIDASLHSSYN